MRHIVIAILLLATSSTLKKAIQDMLVIIDLTKEIRLCITSLSNMIHMATSKQVKLNY